MIMLEIIRSSPWDLRHAEASIKFWRWASKLLLRPMPLLPIDIYQLFYKLLLVWCAIVDYLFSRFLGLYAILNNDLVARY